jgi:Rrf2 family protein
MLRLTKKADYGLLALKYLAEHPGAAASSAKDIAEAYHIPPQLLAKILQRLAKVGLVRSSAGMNGGYTLVREAGRITAFEVIWAIDGPQFLTACTTSKRTCDLTDSCGIKEPMLRVNDAIAQLLKDISIRDLMDDRAKAPDERGPQLVTIQV